MSEAQRARVYDVHRRWLGDLSQQKVLDLGCGHGSPLSGYLAEHAREYHALDLAPNQIAQLRAKLGEAPNRIYTAGDFLSDDYAETGFDIIYAHSVFHRFQHLEIMLHRVVAKLAPQGRVISYDPLETSLPIRLLRRAYRPFQTDRDWEYPFDARALRLIAARYAIADHLGVFGRGKWALIMGIISPRLAARYGDRLFASDFDRKQTNTDIRATLHVSYLLTEVRPQSAPD